MTTRDHLIAYALQFVDDQERAEVFVTDTLNEAEQMKALDSAEKVIQYLVVTIRNKCYDYIRLGKSDELKAAELNVPIGMVRAELKAILEGKFF